MSSAGECLPLRETKARRRRGRYSTYSVPKAECEGTAADSDKGSVSRPPELPVSTLMDAKVYSSLAASDLLVKLG